MNANKILQARKLIRELNFKNCQKLAKEVLTLSSAEEIKSGLQY